jgi:SRR1
MATVPDAPVPEDEGWTTITRATRGKQCRRQRASAAFPYVSRAPRQYRSPPRPDVAGAVRAAAAELKSSAWWKAAAAAVDSDGTPRKENTRLICLGLGSFTKSSNARWQMGAALLLRNLLGVDECHGVVADPAMSAADDVVALELGFVIAQSLSAALALRGSCEDDDVPDSRFVLFMPHCERALYNDVMRRMWGPKRLGRAILFGNSLKLFYAAGECAPGDWTYMDAVVADGVAVEVPCLNASSSPSYEAFNDLSVTRFNAHLSKSMSLDDVWRWRPTCQVADDRDHWDRPWKTNRQEEDNYPVPLT